MEAIDWNQCLRALEAELPEQQFNTWVRPLHALEVPGALKLLAPNRFAVEWARKNLLPRLEVLLTDGAAANAPAVSVEVGSNSAVTDTCSVKRTASSAPGRSSSLPVGSRLQDTFSFSSFVEGSCNKLAKAAAIQVALNPGRAYNPLVIYGGVGLGKTHLMQAIAHSMKERESRARIAYVHSERFVSDMVNALQRNTINDFKNAYRSLDTLLVDDIQFFAGKERSQEEFFHTFNELVEGQHQIILTCDRYPTAVGGVEDRLKSRLASGLMVAVQQPDLETGAAIVTLKARNAGMVLREEVALFLAKRIRSSVRELEGALRRLIAHARFMGEPITVELTQLVLQDLFACQTRRLTIEQIQAAVADHFKLRMSDLVSKRRSRSVARPRQLAMALVKELTSHSLPEIGAAFGGRDHTTVIHACRRINELCATDEDLKQSYSSLLRACGCVDRQGSAADLETVSRTP